jgi:hypothetical protein
MTDESKPSPPPGGQFLVYQTEDGKLKIDVRFEGETVWLTQQHMAELFQTTKQNVGQHLKNILEEGELAQESVVKDFFTTAADGKKALDSIGEAQRHRLGLLVSMSSNVAAIRFSKYLSVSPQHNLG